MAENFKNMQIAWEQLRLDLENYRHEKVETQEDAILYHLQSEKLLELAVDIANVGLNPLEKMGLVELKGSGSRPSFTAVEGNRRTYALILLHDPQRVPTKFQARAKAVKLLVAAAEKADLPNKLDCVVFDSKRSAKPWIDRLHLTEMNGASRRRWTADQIERATSGSGRNRDAMAILDVAQAVGLIGAEDRKRKLTTVQRYLSNPVMRQVLGVIRDKSGKYLVDRPREDFFAFFNQFLEDVKSDDGLSSRSNSDDIVKYAASLTDRVGISERRVETYDLASAVDLPSEDPKTRGKLSSEEEETSADSNQASVRRKIRTKIGAFARLDTLLQQLPGDKCYSLYRSCVDLTLQHHTPLITVGLWSLLETLACLHSDDEKKFINYFSPDRLSQLGFSSRDQKRGISKALKNISENGNTTKHSPVAASFDGQQLANDVDVLTPFLVAVCEEIVARRKAS